MENPFESMNGPEIQSRLAEEKVKMRRRFTEAMEDNSIKFMISAIPEAKVEGALMALLYEMFERGWAYGGLEVGSALLKSIVEIGKKKS